VRWLMLAIARQGQRDPGARCHCDLLSIPWPVGEVPPNLGCALLVLFLTTCRRLAPVLRRWVRALQRSAQLWWVLRWRRQP